MVKRYAHLAPEHLRSAAATLDDVLPKADSKEKAIEAVSASALEIAAP